MKKRKNLRRELAEKLYKDPKSNSYLIKSKSLKEAGYSKVVAEHDASKILGDINFTDEDYANFLVLNKDLPKLVDITQLKIKQLLKSKVVTAKDYVAVLKHIELIAKLAGKLKHIIEKRELKVIITAPADIIKWEELKLELKYYKEKLARLERRSVIDIGEEYKKDAIDVD